jgi:hypothetical protein
MTTLFQSVPDLLFTPPNSTFIDDLAGDQLMFDTFTLGSKSLVTSITFDVSNQAIFFPNWLSEPLTLAVYNVGLGGAPGTEVFSATFTPDANVNDQINFNLSFATALVTYDTQLALNPGTYLITYYNQDGLGAMGFVNGGSDQAFAEHPSTGTISPVGESLGFNLSGDVITPVSWGLGVSGDFATASNWNPAAVPGPANDAIIGAKGTYTVTSSIAESVNSLAILDKSATLLIDGASGFSDTLGGINDGTIVVDDSSGMSRNEHNGHNAVECWDH